MCGISGILQRRPDTAPMDAVRTLRLMNDAQRHRGPDAEGLWSSQDHRCHLGHRRLSVIDLSTAANQPMLDDSGRYAMVFNGEVYNYKDLRQELENKGVRFRTQSDSEVLLRGFIAFGTAVFSKLDAMFSVAIYDSESGVLTIARDAAGEKPLYYIQEDGYFAFASEMRPLLAIPGRKIGFSAAGMALYMALRYVPAPLSIIEGIRKLSAGSILQISPDGNIREESFFSFSKADVTPEVYQDPLAFAEQVESALASSLQARLNSDVPLGAFLSSGVDSALACALLTKRLGKDLKTFSVGFAGDPGSEHTAAADIARILGTEHREFIFGPAAFDDICDKIGTLLDEPNGDRSCVPTYLLSAFAREHVTVAISGDGGDELFAGYARYLGFVQTYGKVSWPNSATVARTYFEKCLPVFPWPGIEAVVPDGCPALTRYMDGFGRLFEVPQRATIQALSMLDFESYMPGAVLAKVDRMSMRHGLEVRTPYLCGPLYDLSRKAPAAALIGPSGQKAVLRNLLAKYLPAPHVSAPKKGFGMPASVFLNNRERVAQELTKARNTLSEVEFFRMRGKSVDKLAEVAGANSNSIWATIVLAKWVESLGVAI